MGGNAVRSGGAGVRGNRSTLRLLLGVLVALTVVVGAIGGVTVSSRSSATEQFAARAEPLAVDLEQVYAALNDADATAAASYLSGGVVSVPLRDEYAADIARAEASLSAASRMVAGDGGVSAQLALVGAQIPVYTGLVATAQTDNRDAPEPEPIGTAYLREASTLLHTELLPETLAAYRSEVGSLDAVKRDASGLPWAWGVGSAFVLVALVVAQRQVSRRTHRVLSPGLLVATGTLILAVVWTSSAVAVHNSRLDDARGQAERIHVLATIEDASVQAHADEALMLIAHGSDDGSYAQDFTAQLKTATASTAAADDTSTVSKGDTATGAAGGAASQLTDVAERLRAWSTLDAHVRASAAADDYPAAVAMALGAGSADAARVIYDSNAEMTRSQQAFVDDANSAASALGGLLFGEIAAALLMAGAVGYGLSRRLAEYR